MPPASDPRSDEAVPSLMGPPPDVNDEQMVTAWLGLADHFDKSDPGGSFPSLLRDAARRLRAANARVARMTDVLRYLQRGPSHHLSTEARRRIAEALASLPDDSGREE